MCYLKNVMNVTLAMMEVLYLIFYLTLVGYGHYTYVSKYPRIWGISIINI